MDRKEKQRLFVDMDGTLAVFKTVERLETLYEKNYFSSLTPNENVVKAIQLLENRHPEVEVYILSSVLSDSKYALPEKNEWLDRYLPIDRERRIFPPCGKDKKDYVPEGIKNNDFLLDDYTFNLNHWEPPAKGIKLLNGINHTNGTWAKAMVSYEAAPETIAKAIIENMTAERIRAAPAGRESADLTEKKEQKIKPKAR